MSSCTCDAANCSVKYVCLKKYLPICQYACAIGQLIVRAQQMIDQFGSVKIELYQLDN